MATFTATFERVEKKYLLTQQQSTAFSAAIAGRMAVDRYGEHTIENIYYDTPSYDLIRASLDKPAYKEKLRVRSYGVPKRDDPVFVELKKKVDGVVYKRRTAMPLCDASRFLCGGRRPQSADGQICNELRYALNFYGAQPMVFVAYDRVAMAGLDDAEFRLTLDKGVRYRTDDLDLSRGSYGKLLLPQGTALLEVKTVGALPLWFARILSGLCIYPVTFSKYGEAYRDMLRQTKEGALVA